MKKIVIVVISVVVIAAIIATVVILVRDKDDENGQPEAACANLDLKSAQNCTNDPNLLTSKLPACCVPYEDYYLARFIDGNSPRVDNSFPPWMNHNLLKCGQKFAHNNWFSLGLAAALGRAANMNNLDIRDVAMFTGVMSTQAEGCEKILASFGAKLTVWFQDVQSNPPTKTPENNDFLQSVNRIRWLHVKLARDIEAKRRQSGYTIDEIVDPATYENTEINDAVWNAFNDDLVNSDIPAEERDPPPMDFINSSIPYFNQHSIALFQYNAFAYPVLIGKVFGVNASDEELWAFNHLNAVIGYTFGLDDKYNLALQPDLESLRTYYAKIFRGYIVPGFFHVHKKTKVTIENIMKATRVNTPAWTLQLYLYRVLTMLVEIPAPNLFSLFTENDKFHDQNLNGNVLPNIAVNETFRRITNENGIADLLKTGEKYYGKNYTTQWGRARFTFLTPVENI
ncbi:uncharacterized protein LOC110849661 isoform X2 [Folsomia candida]|uniref:uncharacterized protein LOC110849661 isoform X2 n=1 Tax=Folsomia candida TaxID=158441 RepID=UPI000B8FE7A1|nr:uncharacterized protein LOC110849661 isoform X2 [Folsomia candida]